MDRFTFDIKIFIQRINHWFFNKAFWVEWFYCQLIKIRTIHSEFLLWGAAKKDELIWWNGQTIVLEQLLITKFGAGIYIENIYRPKRVIFGYPLTDQRNQILYPLSSANNIIIYPIGEAEANPIGFIVYVPDTLSYNSAQLTAYIERYRPAVGCDYEIQSYTP